MLVETPHGNLAHMRFHATILCALALVMAAARLPAQDGPQQGGPNLQPQAPAPQEVALQQELASQRELALHLPEPALQTDEVTVPESYPTAEDRWSWLDKTRQHVYAALWHSAMRVDRWFGSSQDESLYQKGVYGSIAPAVLWDRHYGFSEPFRFNVNLPLPQVDERFHAFIGRFDPNEVVTESSEPSGAFRRQYGPSTQDQTLFGLGFHQPPRQGGYFDAGAGIRLSLPLDPYIKSSYVYERGASEGGLLSLRQTAFWQHSQGFGVTSRSDVERIYNLRWLARLTGSVTFSQKSQGVLWWSAVDVMRGLASRRAIVMEIESDGQTDAPVPLHNYGAKFAYRQSVVRKWLIMEVRSSISWPKDLPVQERRLSPGLGLGFEMLFGTDEFLARPVTF